MTKVLKGIGIVVLFCVLAFFAGRAFAEPPPVSIKGQLGTKLIPKWNLQVPGNQATNLGGIDALIETGNVNLLSNPGFEGAPATTGWTIASGVTCSPDTSDHMDDGGSQSLSCSMSLHSGEIIRQCYSASASSQNFENTLAVKTSLGIVEVCPEVGGAIVDDDCVSVEANAPWRLYSPTSLTSAGQDVCVVARATEATGINAVVKFDSAYVGFNRNIGTVAQARYFGGMTQTGSSSCSRGENSSSGLTNFVSISTNDTDCTNAWSADGGVTAVGTTNHQALASNMPAGSWAIEVTGEFGTDSTGTCLFQLYDGTNGYQPQAVRSPTAATGNVSVGSLRFHVSYTDSGSRTFSIRAADDHGGNCFWGNTAANTQGASWKFYYFPSQSQTVVRADQTNWPTRDFGENTITGTISNPAKGTRTIDKFVARRDGEYLIGTISFIQTGTGSAGSGDYLWTIPAETGCRIDPTKTTFYTGGGGTQATIPSTVGRASVAGNSSAQAWGSVVPYDATRVRIFAAQSTTLYNFMGSAWYQLSAAAINVTANFEIPCVDWRDNGKAPQLVNTYVTDSDGVEKGKRVKFGGASETSNCTSSPCTIYRGLGISQVTRTGTGAYTLTFDPPFTGTPQCFGNAMVIGSAYGFIDTVGTSCSASSCSVQIANSSGNPADGTAQVKCEGPR